MMNGISETTEQSSEEAVENTSLVSNHEPKSDSEIYLASLWKEIIGLKQVLLLDKFLDVGGNSLTLNLLLGKIETKYGVSMEPESFFEPDKSSLYILAKELDILLQQADKKQ